MREHFGFVSPRLKVSIAFAFSPFQLPPALDTYKSVYMKDYCWHDDYHSPIQAHVPVPCSFPALHPQPELPAPVPAQMGTQQGWVLSAPRGSDPTSRSQHAPMPSPCAPIPPAGNPPCTLR